MYNIPQGVPPVILTGQKEPIDRPTRSIDRSTDRSTDRSLRRRLGRPSGKKESCSATLGRTDIGIAPQRSQTLLDRGVKVMHVPFMCPAASIPACAACGLPGHKMARVQDAKRLNASQVQALHVPFHVTHMHMPCSTHASQKNSTSGSHVLPQRSTGETLPYPTL